MISFQRVDIGSATTPLDQLHSRVTENHADELWKALSHLRHLTRLFFSDLEFPDDEDQYDEENVGGSGGPFFWNVSLVTRLR